MPSKRSSGDAESKRDRRLARKEAEARAQKAAQRRKRLTRAAAWAAVGTLLAAGVWIFFRPGPEISGVERPPNQGRQHITQGTPINYDHPAPTSGPHWPAAPPCRVYTEPLELELAVHALEHGGVVIWHHPDLEPDQIDALRVLAGSWESHVIVSPNLGITEPIVATAWNRRLSFAEPGKDLEEFVRVYRLRGPERVDCPQIR